MHSLKETANALSEITDAGQFEQLATEVLRHACPDLYGNLTQPGINAEGKTVKSPVDAISYVRGSNSHHLVLVQHTTCKQSDIRKKWMSDRPGQRGRSGDIFKAACIAAEERQRSPDLRVTLALTTNKEPPEDVTRDAVSLADSHGIKLEIWSRSRITSFLDNDPNGQRLRWRFLRIEQERLSHDLLRELG